MACSCGSPAGARTGRPRAGVVYVSGGGNYQPAPGLPYCWPGGVSPQQ
ncbi:hypothetical protein ACIPLC_11380 [Kitasatospora sp. NPDC086801]